jgi:hypothetical protein
MREHHNYLLSSNLIRNRRWNGIITPNFRGIRSLKLKSVQVEDLNDATIQTGGRVSPEYAAKNEHLVRVCFNAFMSTSAMRGLTVISFNPRERRDGQDVNVIRHGISSIDPIVSSIYIDIVRASIGCCCHDGAEES